MLRLLLLFAFLRFCYSFNILMVLLRNRLFSVSLSLPLDLLRISLVRIDNATRFSLNSMEFHLMFDDVE